MRVIASAWAYRWIFLEEKWLVWLHKSSLVSGKEAVLFRWDTRGKLRKRHERQPDRSTFFFFSKIKSRGLNRHRTFDKASITERRYTGAIAIGTFFLISFLLGIAIALGFRFFADPWYSCVHWMEQTPLFTDHGNLVLIGVSWCLDKLLVAKWYEMFLPVLSFRWLPYLLTITLIFRLSRSLDP